MKYLLKKGFSIFFILPLFFYSFQSNTISVKDYGAKGDGTTNDLSAIQHCIEDASKTGKTCFVPAGTYKVEGTLYLMDNVKLTGQGAKSILNFTKGYLTSEKNKRRDFYYTDNYANEVIPGKYPHALLTENSAAGDKTIDVDSDNDFHVGDRIYLFNGIKTTWTLLENKAKPELWNDNSIPVARSENFKITAISGNKITLDAPVSFDYSKNSVVSKLVGGKNITIENLTITNKVSPFAIIFEQPEAITISAVTINANGGIALSDKAINCLIQNCSINVEKSRAIDIEYFGSNNKVINNVVNYQGGGDAAILVMMSCYSNLVDGNTVNGFGLEGSNEIGIAIHATSYRNTVTNNKINGTAEGLGTYYRANNNVFAGNTIENCLVGYNAFYSQNNTVKNNIFNIHSQRKGQAIGFKLYNSNKDNIYSNSVSGELVLGILVQSSQDNSIKNNTFKNSDIGKYASAVRTVGTANNTIEANTFNSFKFGLNFINQDNSMSKANHFGRN